MKINRFIELVESGKPVWIIEQNLPCKLHSCSIVRKEVANDWFVDNVPLYQVFETEKECTEYLIQCLNERIAK